jgi:hypothetical protein
MKLAILLQEPYKDNKDIFIQIEPDLFRELLIRYTLELGDVGLAFDRVAEDLKKEIIHR